MDSQKEEAVKMPSLTVAVIGFLAIMATVIWAIRSNFGPPMAIFLGAVVSTILALALGRKWEYIVEHMCKSLKDCMVPLLINMNVGIIIGVWIICGTLPTLIFYGLKMVRPEALIPLSFIFCMLLSLFTGTALGSISTGGVPLIAIAMSMGIPLEPVAGAIVSGACFGDKMSPMSDTTNLAPAICGTDIYSHIRSMMYTTVPATIVVFIMYVFLGFHFTADSAAQSNIPEVLNSLQANFNISLWTLIPPLLVLASAIKKVPALMAMVTVGLISMVLAVVIQHASLNDVMNTAYNGFVAHTGNKQMDAILSKGGVKMMTDLIVLLLFAGAMGGAITASGIMDSILEKGLLKLICNVRRVVFTCMIYCYLISMITGKQPLSLILSGKTFVPFFDRLDIDRKVLSRTTEDAGTLSVAVIPWSGMGILAVSVLGVSIGYIRYTFLPFVVPIFSMICAFTNFGIWHADGTPKWGKNKKKNDQLGLAN